jgi:hypothetical protein
MLFKASTHLLALALSTLALSACAQRNQAPVLSGLNEDDDTFCRATISPPARLNMSPAAGTATLRATTPSCAPTRSSAISANTCSIIRCGRNQSMIRTRKAALAQSGNRFSRATNA